MEWDRPIDHDVCESHQPLMNSSGDSLTV